METKSFSGIESKLTHNFVTYPDLNNSAPRVRFQVAHSLGFFRQFREREMVLRGDVPGGACARVKIASPRKRGRVSVIDLQVGSARTDASSCVPRHASGAAAASCKACRETIGEGE
jgi:hypothetical protein